MEEKAQVNVEYLLVIVAGVVVVTIVSLFIKNIANSTADAAVEAADINA